MGKPDAEEPTQQPEGDADVALEDVEVALTLTLGSSEDGARSEEDAEVHPLAVCQICMDVFGSRDMVRRVCGAQCLAEICPTCMVQHLTATVYSYYPGVLPKMRCPVCLVTLHKSQWAKYVGGVDPAAVAVAVAVVEEPATEALEQAHTQEQEQAQAGGAEEEEDETPAPTQAEAHTAAGMAQDADAWRMEHAHVLEKYEMLCRQSCGFQAPCCHNPDYTMLPKVGATMSTETIQLPRAQAVLVPALCALYQAYCFHREPVTVLYEFIMNSFGTNAEEMLDLVLWRTEDDERRACLLLHHLFVNPNTFTDCCDYRVCFKCKAATHHDGACGDFEEDQCVLDCPGCRVTLVKVDGCDTVTCLCGYSFEWPAEMEKQRLQRKKLAPAKADEYQAWRRWAHRLDRCLERIDALEDTWTEIRRRRAMRDHQAALRVLLQRALRRARLNLMIGMHRERLRKLLRARLALRTKHKQLTTVEGEYALEARGCTRANEFIAPPAA